MFFLRLTYIKYVIAISFLLEPFTAFSHDIWLCDYDSIMWIWLVYDTKLHCVIICDYDMWYHINSNPKF